MYCGVLLYIRETQGVYIQMKKVIDSFTILHLSDLHIIDHNGSYSTALNRMIDYINNLTSNDENIIITITGDIVEKGQFKEHEDAIIKFFQDLADKFKTKIVDILFVPGNHDKVRGNLKLENADNSDSFWNAFKEKDWKYFEKQFQDYINYVMLIRESGFNLKPTFSGTYGIHSVTIGNHKICFICINSSWACMGDQDKGNLRIGRFQLNDLKSEYEKISKDIDLTIALMHHPSDWLMPMEVDYLNQFLADEYRLNTNIVLQGHVHEKNLYNWYNQSHSITTLVTGMGWDQQQKLHDGGHRFSIYRISFDNNIVQVNTYVTDKSGEFIEDTNLYNGKNARFPLYIHKYLNLSELPFESNEISVYYPNKNIFKDVRLLNENMINFIYSMYEVIESYKMEWEEIIHFNDCIYKIIEEILPSVAEDVLLDEKNTFLEKNIIEHDNYKEKISLFNVILKEKQTDTALKSIIVNFTTYFKAYFRDEEIKGHKLDKSSTKVYLEILNEHRKNQLTAFKKERFLSFLSEFNTRLQANIFNQEKFKKNDIVRFHFRYTDGKNDPTYKKLCTYKIELDDKGIMRHTNDTSLTDISYKGSLIEKSFNTGRSLLFSLNPSSNNLKKEDDWLDFLTIAIADDYNTYKIEDGVNVLKYPCLSFGITVNNTFAQDIIRYLSYNKFEKIIHMLFLKFIKTIPCKISDFIKE